MREDLEGVPFCHIVCWAVLSAGELNFFPVPPYTYLTIFLLVGYTLLKQSMACAPGQFLDTINNNPLSKIYFFKIESEDSN